MEDYARLNKAVISHHILPRYDRLAAASEALRKTADKTCVPPVGAAALKDLRQAYLGANEAWQGIQHVRFGPVDLFMRSMRFAFWPDARNVTGKQLDEILRGRAAETITQKSFATGEVAVQGLPALERLLYGEEGSARLAARDAEAAFRCDLIRAIGANLAGMAADIRRDWTGGAEPYDALMVKGGGPYAEPKEATLDLFKSLYAAIELVADHKLAKPLGPSAKGAKATLAESFRSRQSMANIRTNLAAAEALYLGEDGSGFSAFVREVAGDKALDDLFRRAFKQTRETAASVSKPLEEAIKNEDERKKLVQLGREVSALKTLLAQRLTAALDIPVGFNALDGD